MPNAGGTPQDDPFQTNPDGQTQLLPFHTVPPEQTLTQLEPFQAVPLGQLTQLEPFQLEPDAQAAEIDFVVELEPYVLKLVSVQVIVPGLLATTPCEPLLPWDAK